MSLFDELESQIGTIFSTQWDVTNGQKIPEAEHVKLGNHAVNFVDLLTSFLAKDRAGK